MSRRDVKKNIIAWLCVLVFLISLTGCGNQDTKTDHTLRVGVVTYTPDDPFINAMTDIIKSNLKAKESNTMKVIVSVRSGDNDQQEQDEIVEEIEKELTRTFYTLKSHEKEVKVIYKEDLFSDEIERFLYSYE